MVPLDDSPRVDIAATSVSPHQVKLALAYLRSNYRERVRLSDLADACSTSKRTLLRQFKHFVGVSPLVHLHRLRLTAARTELMQGTVSVSEAAFRCGFAHFGRFAEHYRRAFGEHPSDTRLRADGRRLAAGGSNVALATRWLPSLRIVPLRTESVEERRVAQDLAEQIAAALSRMRIASVRYADPLRIEAIKLARNGVATDGTEYCLQGRLREDRGRVRVTLWLLDAASGRHVWGDSYDGASDSLFELQRRIVEDTLCGVVPGITSAEIDRIGGKDQEALGARDLLKQAMPLFMRMDVPSQRKAFAIASQAMDLDPDDALPAALAAYSQARLFLGDTAQLPAVTRDRALRLSRLAGNLDVADPLVTTARSAVAAILGQHDDEEALIDRALAMDPTSGWAWERRGFLYCWCKPDQAIDDFQRALRLHGPRMPRENCLHGIAMANRAAGRLDAAIRWELKALAENPGATMLHKFVVFHASRLDERCMAQRSGDELRRAHPELTITSLADADLIERPECMDFLRRVGVPV